MRSSRVVAVYLIVAVSVACNSASPVAPTPIVATPPPAPTPTPPPAPAITNYAGRWQGEYVVFQCAGSSGSMDDVLCSAPRPGNPGGIFQRDARFPIAIELSQTGSAVNGVMHLGQMRGPVTGSVVNNRLILSGTITFSDASVGLTVTNVITQFDAGITSDLLTGDFGLNVKFNVLPGDGTVRLRLQNMRR